MRIIAKRKNMDLTQGDIGKQLVLFALPLLGASLLQQLYNTVDLLFVGNLLSKQSYAAVGASSLIITCMVVFFSGMSVGSNVVISQAIGSKDKTRIHNSVHTAVALSIIGGIVLTIVGLIGAPFFLRLMNTAPEIIGEATTYLRIYFLSLVSIITYNMAAGIIRAMGDSNTPMLIQAVGGVCNVIGDAILLYMFRNVNAVAWATMISQTLAAVLSVLYLMYKGEICNLHLNKLTIHKETFMQILKIGVPAGIQNLVITISNICAQYHINSLGVDAIGAFTTYFKVELLLYHPIIAMGQAMTTFTGQNIGAGKAQRVRKGVKISILLGITLCAGTTILLLLFGRQAFALFNGDANVIENGLKVIRITFPFYWIYVILEIFADTVRGAGKATQPMIVILVNICILRVILLFTIMSQWHDIRGIAITYPITWTTTAVCMFMCYKKNLLKRETSNENQCVN